MLTDTQFEELLNSESDRVERKRSFSDPDRAQEAMCAFANDLPNHRAPGVFVVGIEDDGSCAGLAIDDGLLLQLAELRDNGRLLPFPSIVVQKRTVNGCEVAVVIVQPSRSLPVRFRGRVWIRVGPRRAIATPEEERQLFERQQAFNLPFDAREAPTTTAADLDIAYVRDEYLPAAIAPDVLAQNQRPIEHQLGSIHFLGSNAMATHVGLLVAGVDALSSLPGGYIQFVRFDGTELTDPIRDQKTISGRIADVLRRVDEILQANIEVRVSFTASTVEERRPGYPLPALQQNDYRNPHLAEAMKNLGFVQRFGVGIATARRELKNNGNAPVEFDVQPTAVLSVVRRRP